MIIVLSDWYGRLRWKLCKKARVSMERVHKKKKKKKKKNDSSMERNPEDRSNQGVAWPLMHFKDRQSYAENNLLCLA